VGMDEIHLIPKKNRYPSTAKEETMT